MHVNSFIDSARSLVGAEWHHAGRSAKRVDCVGVLILAARASGYRCQDINYSRYPDGESLVAELAGQLDPVPIGSQQPGDVLVFTFSGRKRIPQHVGIMTWIGVVHSWQSQKAVVEHCLDEHWLKRVTNVFRLREDRWQP